MFGAESNSLHSPMETKPEPLGSSAAFSPNRGALGIVRALDLRGLISVMRHLNVASSLIFKSKYRDHLDIQLVPVQDGDSAVGCIQDLRG